MSSNVVSHIVRKYLAAHIWCTLETVFAASLGARGYGFKASIAAAQEG